MTKIAIIGAGLSGITAANQLKNHADITIFEKSRGVGGRMSTRRAEPYCFDHGAQFFTASTHEFKDFIYPMLEKGIIQRWQPRFKEIKHRKIIPSPLWGTDDFHYVGAPSMNAIAKYLSQGLPLNLGINVKSMVNITGQWFLEDEDGNPLGTYDWVIVTAPAEQAAALLPSELPFYSTIKSISMQACFSLMLGFKYPLPLEFDAALVHGEDIRWICMNHSKPDRNHAFCLLIHSTHTWANAHINDPHNQVIDYLCQQTSHIIGHDVSKAQHQEIHGWRYATIEKHPGHHYFIDTKKNIGVCGDWCIEGCVEAAFISGNGLANTLIEQLPDRQR